MERLLEFLSRIRLLLLTLLLEAICFYLLITYNTYHHVVFFSSANYVTGSIKSLSSGVSRYFTLNEVNTQLAKENSELREELSNLTAQKNQWDLSRIKPFEPMGYDFIPARALEKNIGFAHNYITINKGTKDGFRENMGIISPQGLVGKVRIASRNFSVVTTILHENLRIAAKLEKQGNTGSLVWKANDPQHSTLEFIPPHVKVSVGDPVVSEETTIFPEGIRIGQVAAIERGNQGENLFILVKLSVDFLNLEQVYGIVQELSLEKDSLESQINDYRYNLAE